MASGRLHAAGAIFSFTDTRAIKHLSRWFKRRVENRIPGLIDEKISLIEEKPNSTQARTSCHLIAQRVLITASAAEPVFLSVRSAC